jgi:hypothetical protein
MGTWEDFPVRRPEGRMRHGRRARADIREHGGGRAIKGDDEFPAAILVRISNFLPRMQDDFSQSVKEVRLTKHDFL